VLCPHSTCLGRPRLLVTLRLASLPSHHDMALPYESSSRSARTSLWLRRRTEIHSLARPRPIFFSRDNLLVRAAARTYRGGLSHHRDRSVAFVG